MHQLDSSNGGGRNVAKFDASIGGTPPFDRTTVRLNNVV